MRLLGIFEDWGIEIPEEFDTVYAEAPIKRQVADLPVGYYTGYIESFKLHRTEDDRLYVKIDIVIMTEGWEGFLATKWIKVDFNDSSSTSKRLKTNLLILHYDWHGIRSLGDKRKWEGMKGLVVQFHITRSKKYANPSIWFRRAPRMITKEEKEKFRYRGDPPPEQKKED